MNAFRGTADKDLPPLTGILITNLGTPDSPTAPALRRYLTEFLSDRRVVEMPRWLWWPILHGVILRLRPARAARAYRRVWTDDGSPLLSISRRQEAALQQLLARHGEQPVKVVLGMRYGNPSIAAALEELRQANVTRLLVLPLYPQYSGTTTGSTFDAVTEELRHWRRVPVLRLLADYHDFDPWLEALANSIRRHWSEHGESERLMFSFHGLPQRYHRHGDPYAEQCQVSAQRVAEKLGLSAERWALCFQSRFGREEWLKPYTDATLRQWASEGVRRVDLICPGFAADCLETLEEINMENREVFLAHGGEQFHYIPALNAHPSHMEALAALVRREAGDWLQES
ncbi:MAG TPA: ferrochelatase [Gammaproteobacteria bacterium]|nr:ferrochelatase [Gammaproteobacteria bacterium]